MESPSLNVYLNKVDTKFFHQLFYLYLLKRVFDFNLAVPMLVNGEEFDAYKFEIPEYYSFARDKFAEYFQGMPIKEVKKSCSLKIFIQFYNDEDDIWLQQFPNI